MCLAMPGRVLEIVDPEARVARIDVMGTTRTVNVSLLDQAAAGDWVLVSMGYAVERIPESVALETLRLFKELAPALEEAARPAGGEGAGS